jgi:hypothetical protein
LDISIAVYLDLLNPDPAFQVDADTDPIRSRVLMALYKLKKVKAEFFHLFFDKKL